MSATSTSSFALRSKRIVRNNRAIARGAELQLDQYGLLTVRPRRLQVRGLPFRGLLLIAMLVFGAKAMMLAQAGPTSYDARIERLAAGGALEQAGAWVLQKDRVSLAVGDYLSTLIN